MVALALEAVIAPALGHLARRVHVVLAEDCVQIDHSTARDVVSATAAGAGRTRPIEGAKARIKKFIEDLDPRFISLYGGGSGQDVNGALDRVWSHTRTLNDIGH